MALDLTPEQQEIFDRVVGIVTQNDELRLQYKAAITELHQQPNWNDYDYLTDSDEPPAVNSREAVRAVQDAVRSADLSLETTDSYLFSQVVSAICTDFFKK